MSKTFMVFLALLAATPSFSQTRKDYEEVIGKFKTYYNKNQPDGVYKLFAPRVQSVMTPDNTRKMFVKMNNEQGKLNTFSLMKQDEHFSFYKLNYTKGPLIMVLFLNNENKIQNFRIHPYDADTSKLR